MLTQPREMTLERNPEWLNAISTSSVGVDYASCTSPVTCLCDSVCVKPHRVWLFSQASGLWWVTYLKQCDTLSLTSTLLLQQNRINLNQWKLEILIYPNILFINWAIIDCTVSGSCSQYILYWVIVKHNCLPSSSICPTAEMLKKWGGELASKQTIKWPRKS